MRLILIDNEKLLPALEYTGMLPEVLISQHVPRQHTKTVETFSDSTPLGSAVLSIKVGDTEP